MIFITHIKQANSFFPQADELQDLFPLFVMTSLSNLKSQWVEIRGHAALLAGLLYSHLNEENKPRVSLDTVCDRLLKLLNDENPEVRTRAIMATAYLFLNWIYYILPLHSSFACNADRNHVIPLLLMYYFLRFCDMTDIFFKWWIYLGVKILLLWRVSCFIVGVKIINLLWFYQI